MGKWFIFCSVLYFNNMVIFGYYYVYVGFCGGVFDVFQIVDGFVIYDIDGDCGYYFFYWIGFQFVGGDQFIQCIGQCYVGIGNGGSVGVVVGLQYIVVESNCEFVQCFQVNCCVQCMGNQVLNFYCLVVLFVFCCFMCVMCVCRMWQYVVFSGDLVLVLVFQEMWNVFVNRGSVQYFGIIEFDQYGVFSVFCVIMGQGDGMYLISVMVCWMYDRNFWFEMNVRVYYMNFMVKSLCLFQLDVLIMLVQCFMIRF